MVHGDSVPTAHVTPPMPEQLDRDRTDEVLAETYRITRCIASGGMGTVYEATHLRQQQRFSVKFLEHRLARNGEAYARFRQEAEIAASLDHEAIVQVFDFNTDAAGNPYMVMEFVDGVTLSDWMLDHRATPRELLWLFEPLCGALAAAHAAGIVHRDLKPSNIMVRTYAENGATRLGVKLLDFGISKMRSAGQAMTRTNVVMGTPNYMSPEQAAGNTNAVDATTDVFALGAILYELLAGRRAFDNDAAAGLLHAIVYEHPPSLASIVPELPPALVAVVERCLAKTPSDRFPDTVALLVALRGALRGMVAARRTVDVAPVETVRPRTGSKAALWIGGWAGSVALAAVAASWWVGGRISAEPLPAPVAAPAAVALPTTPATNEPSFRDELATPGALVLELGTQLYRADARGLSYWSDPEAETVMRPLPSAASVTAMAHAREGDLLLAQGDGTVSRWDRELREAPWHQRIGGGPIHALAAAAGYLAIASGTEVQLLHAESGKPLRKFDGVEPVVALMFTRHPSETLMVVRRDALELLDADKRKSLGVAPLAGRALRAAVVAEPIDGPAEIEIDFVQADWLLRRRFRVHPGRKGQGVRLEPVSQKRI